MDELCERWGVSEDTVKGHIRDDQLPFVPIGGGKKRPIYRFRLAAIQAWEGHRERTLTAPEAPAPPPPTVASMWDGKVRGSSGKGRRKQARA